MDTKEYASHWEKVFATKAETEFSWLQHSPKTSIDFLESFNLEQNANIIDVGGGDSYFIDALLERGYKNIYLLDLSANAIERVKKRLGDNAFKVHFIHSDILDFDSEIKFDLWHDRAALHFLTTDENVSKYVSIASNAIKPGGYFVLGTFAKNGPLKCSGLDIRQYDEADMAKVFGEGFNQVRFVHESHLTPFNTSQQFLFCGFQRKSI